MKTLLIVRSEEQLAESIKYAEGIGFRVISAPMIEIKARDDPEFGVFLQRVLNCEVDYVIFTSVNGIKIALEKAGSEEFIKALNKTKVIVIGPKTKRALEEAGVKDLLMPEKYSSKGILEEYSLLLSGKKVEIVRSIQGDPELIKGLSSAGADVHEVKIYEVTRPTGEAQANAIKQAPTVDIFAFTSSTAVENYLKTAEELGLRNLVIEIMNSRMVAAIGELTARKLWENGIKVDIIPECFTFEDLLNAIKRRVD
ncbi:MAG: uroporphyrinogen-III synthase [Methanocellales archaeon]